MTKKVENDPKVTLFGETFDDGKERKFDPENIGWGAMFIFGGIILLLNSFEYLPWNIWERIIRFWPIMIIVLGIKIILGNNVVSRFVTGIIILILSLSLLIYILSSVSPEMINWVPMNVIESTSLWEVVER